MKITITDEYKDSKITLPSFDVPVFVNKMKEFIDRAKQLEKNAPKIIGSYDHLGIVGIGGSQVQPYVFKPHSKVSVTHLEVPDPYILNDFQNKEIEKTKILYLSRSGTTKEVLSFIPYLMDYSSIVVTNRGPLQEIANQLGWTMISVSHDISGRFAIQNELGIMPMIAMGIDSNEFLTSLKNSYKKFFKEGSHAEQVAIAIFNLEQSGIAKMRILPSGIYTQGLGILLTQLINESVPKNPQDKIDASIHIMPRGAHSDLQRWYGGEKDSFIFSLSCSDYIDDEQPLDVPPEVRKLVPGSRAKSGSHLNITSKAVEDTFPGPVFKLVLEKDTVSETANVVGFLHAVTIRLCQIKGSNPFNQPAVQEYKTRATEIYQKLKK
jgi:glucose-6-phosphate isomerase